MHARLTILLAACCVAACAPMVPAPAVAPSQTPSSFPVDIYRLAVARGEPVYRIDTARSLVVVRVYRGGALARFGHDHVIAIRDVQGFVLRSATSSAQRADVYAPLASLSVDEQALRAQAGFDTQPSQQDIEGTKQNMLEKVLAAGQYPFVSLRLTDVAGDLPTLTASAAITLHGRTVTLPIAVALDTPSTNQLYARGRFAIKQTDFGVEPYSLLGGALRVEDRVDIEFELAATRVPEKGVN